MADDTAEAVADDAAETSGSTPIYALAPLAAASLWGGMYVVSKWGFSAIPPVTLGFLRVALGAAALLALVHWTPLRSGGASSYPEETSSYPEETAADRPRSSRSGVMSVRRFSREDWRKFVVLGWWVTVTIVTQFVGTDLTNASQGALLTVLTPVFTLLLGVVVLSEPLTRRKLSGMALAAAGTLLVLAGRYDLAAMAGGNAAGVAALLAASFGWAAYTVYGKPLVRRYSALETATYSTVAAVPMLGVLALGEIALTGFTLGNVPLTLPVVGAVLYLGLASTAAAWYLWYKGLEYVDAGTVAVFFFAQPLVGTLLGAIFLDESVGTPFIVGGGVMALGVYLVSTATSV